MVVIPPCYWDKTFCCAGHKKPPDSVWCVLRGEQSEAIRRLIEEPANTVFLWLEKREGVREGLRSFLGNVSVNCGLDHL